jgi:hypothetical protein
MNAHYAIYSYSSDAVIRIAVDTLKQLGRR